MIMFDRMIMCLCLGFPFAACALLACSGPDLQEPFDGFYESPERDEELGTLEQALTWQQGFGNLSVNTGAECQAPWFDDDVCFLPGRETWNIRWDCTGCTTLMQQAITNTKTVFANRMAPRGVTINWVTGSSYDVYINRGPCSSGSPSCFGQGTPSTLDDLYWMTGTSSLAREYHTYTINMNYDAVDISGLTNNQIRYAYGNVGLHELGHLVGLAHTVPGNCMEVTPQPGAFAICTYSTTQYSRLVGWSPNTND